MHYLLMHDYFSKKPIFGPDVLYHRYHMKRELFLSILERVCLHDSYFV